jgi:hypothetical protein
MQSTLQSRDGVGSRQLLPGGTSAARHRTEHVADFSRTPRVPVSQCRPGQLKICDCVALGVLLVFCQL